MANIQPGVTGYNTRFGDVDAYETKKRNGLLEENDFYIVDYNDEIRAFLGDKPINKRVHIYNTKEEKPINLISDTIYICKSPAEVFWYDGSDEYTILPRVEDAIDADETGNDNHLCTIRAVKDYVTTTTVSIDPDTKHWMIGDVDTGVVAEGNANAIIEIDPDTKHWFISNEDTGVVAEATIPHIDPDSKNWMLGDEDTGVKAVLEATDINYSELNELPKINEVELTGDLDSSDLGLTPASHMDKGFNSDKGVHNMRFKNGYFQIYNPDTSLWENCYMCVDMLDDLEPTVFSCIPSGNSISITWADSSDVTDGYGRANKWKSITIVRNSNHYPVDVSDGTVVFKSAVRNSHKIEPLIDNGLTGGTQYFYTAFVKSSNGIIDPKVNQFTVSTTKHSLPALKYIDHAIEYNAVKITFEEPDDTTNATWEKTVIVRKQGSRPDNPNDGITVANITTRNKYRDQYFIDKIPEDDVGWNWYYQVFLVTTDSVVTSADADGFIVKVNMPPVYTIQIDKNEMDPYARVTYMDDASSFVPATVTHPVANEDGTYTTQYATINWGSWESASFVKMNSPYLVNTEDDYIYPDPSNPGYDMDGDALPEDLSDYDWYVSFPVWGVKYEETDEYLTVSFTPSPYETENGFIYEAYKWNDDANTPIYPFSIGCYPTSIDTTIANNTRYRSVTGIPYDDGKIARCTYKNQDNVYDMLEAFKSHREGDKNTGTYDGILNYYQYNLLHFLMILAFKTTNIEQLLPSASVTGYEYITGNLAPNNSWAHSKTRYGSKFFGIENLFSTKKHMFDGLRLMDIEDKKHVLIFSRHYSDGDNYVILDKPDLFIDATVKIGDGTIAGGPMTGYEYTQGTTKNYFIIDNKILFPHEFGSMSNKYYGNNVTTVKATDAVTTEYVNPIFSCYDTIGSILLDSNMNSTYANRTNYISNIIRYNAKG